MTDSKALALCGGIEKAHAMSQSNSLDPVRLSNLIQTAKVMEDIEYYPGLYGSDSRLMRLELPQSLCLCDETIG